LLAPEVAVSAAGATVRTLVVGETE